MTETPSTADILTRAWNETPSRRPELATDPDLPTALWREAADRHPLEASANPALGLAALSDPDIAARLGCGLRNWIRRESQADRWGPVQMEAIHAVLVRVRAVIAETLFERTNERGIQAAAAPAGIFFALLDDERSAAAVRDAMEVQGAVQVAAWLLDPEHRERLLGLFRGGRLPTAPLFRIPDAPRAFNPDQSPAHLIARAALADAEAGLDAWLDIGDPDIADGLADEILWAREGRPSIELFDACLRAHAAHYPANVRMVQRWLRPPPLEGAMAYVNATDREIAHGPIGEEWTKGSFYRVIAQRNACGEIGRWSDLVRDALAKKSDDRLIRTALTDACRRTDWPIELRAVVALHLRQEDGGSALRAIEQEPVPDARGLGLRLNQFICRMSGEQLDVFYGDRLRDDEATTLPMDIATLRALRDVAIRHLPTARR